MSFLQNDFNSFLGAELHKEFGARGEIYGWVGEIYFTSHPKRITETLAFEIQGNTKSSPGVTLSPWQRLKLTLPNLYHNNRRSRDARKYAPGEMKIIPHTELTDLPLFRRAQPAGERNLEES